MRVFCGLLSVALNWMFIPVFGLIAPAVIVVVCELTLTLLILFAEYRRKHSPVAELQAILVEIVPDAIPMNVIPPALFTKRAIRTKRVRRTEQARPLRNLTRPATLQRSPLCHPLIAANGPSPLQMLDRWRWIVLRYRRSEQMKPRPPAHPMPLTPAPRFPAHAYVGKRLAATRQAPAPPR